MTDSWTPEGIERLPWFRELQGFVQAEIDRAGVERARHRPALEKEVGDIKARLRGWALSLGNSDLHPDARAVIEGEMTAATERLRAVDDVLAASAALADAPPVAVDPRSIADRLTRLRDVLAGENASRTNVELARHIDAIRCYRDGRVVVRTCKLGALALESQASQLFSGGPAAGPEPDGTRRGRPRKRGVRRLDTADAGADLRQEAHWAADVHRFADLGEDWFWEDEYHIPEATYWSKEHALEVAKLKIEGDRMTNDRMAEHFGVTVPTIRKALRHAVERQPELAALLGKIPRTRWEDLHYREVYKLQTEEKLSVKLLCAHFKVSEPTIRKALELARGDGPAGKSPEATTDNNACPSLTAGWGSPPG